ncbi:MAG: hypothetical protein H0T79_17505 [Deltaproteobacteria bacterium]|nr:hypothetical protein [Deltaproteobacteria bacterium]
MLIAVGAASGVEARPPGKIVRVERPRISRASPVFCPVVSDDTAVCVGPEPRKADTIIVLDETAPVAELRIEEITPATPGCTSLWNVRTTLLWGSLTRRGTGVSGMPIARAGHVIQASELPSSPGAGTIAVGIDADGDDQADLLVTRDECDSQPQGMCFSIYVRDRTRHRLTSALNLQPCMQ